MRITIARILPILALAVAARAPRLDAQQPDVRARHAAAADSAAYSSNAADFVVGKHVFLRSTKTLIGTISDVDPNRSFPSTFHHPRMKAVLIQFAGGSKSWIPVEGITRIYVTR